MRRRPYVLVVEDDADHRLIIGAILRRLLPPTEVALVDSGEAAVRYLTGMIPFDCPTPELPGLVLLDLKLPGLSGLELLEWIKSTSGPDVPVIVFTASADPADRRRALELGAEEYQQKSGDFTALIDVVKPYLRPGMGRAQEEEGVG